MKCRITFILALKDRHEETVNWIKNNIYKDFYYLVLDGSLRNSNKKIFEKFKLKNLNYIRCKKDHKNIDYYSKLYFGACKVKTDYVMQVDNDDFINPSAIKKVISYLDKNQNIDFAQGYISGVNSSLNYYYISDYRENNCQHLQSKNNKKKIYNLLKQYKLLWYSVYRKNFYKIVNEKTKNFNCKNYINNEILHALLSLSYGNFKFLNCISYIRKTNPIFSSFRNAPEKMIKDNIYEINEILNYIEKINKFKKNSLFKMNYIGKKILVVREFSLVRLLLYFLRKIPFSINNIIKVNNFLLKKNF